jgi:4-hydroxybutyrate dehydrogenase/sulfolactaldehyde 3-reductase
MAKIGFIGLGRMGLSMTRNLVEAGHHVWAFDIFPAAMDKAAGHGCHSCSTATEAATGREFVVTMLPNGPDVEDTLFGANGVVAAMDSATVFIDMSTIAPSMTDSLANRLSSLGIRMIDAPVGGTSEYAEKGELLILAGGTAEDVATAAPLFSAMGRETLHCGGNGTGTRTKIINNYMSTALNALTAETLAFAETAGLDLMLTARIMAGTAAGKGFLSGAYDRKVFSGDISPEFALGLASKDLNLALAYGADLDVPLGVGAAAAQLYSVSRSHGLAGNDWSAILHTMRQMSRPAMDEA